MIAMSVKPNFPDILFLHQTRIKTVAAVNSNNGIVTSTHNGPAVLGFVASGFVVELAMLRNSREIRR